MKHLDAVVYGEGEITFVELLNCLRDRGDIAGIKGIAYRKKEGQIVMNPARELINNLDDLPMPAYDMFPIQDYVPTPNLVRRYPTLALQVTRGCPHQCSFCQYNLALGKGYRHRSIEKIIEELTELKSMYGMRGVVFRDSSLTINTVFLKDLCNAMINNKLDLKWMCYSRTDIIAKHYRELLPLMKKAGCWQIGYGCESANQKSLDMMRKGTTIADNITAVNETIRAGMFCSTTWILCLPGETAEDSWRTFSMAKKLASHVTKFFLPVPYPNTDFEKTCEEDGGLRKEASYDDYNLMTRNSLVYVNPLIGEDRMIKMVTDAYKLYYTNHKVLFRNLVAINDWDMIKKYWAFAKMI
jgi:radical SAM superfamily enzyme YgiQ (UPF0313 family)